MYYRALPAQRAFNDWEKQPEDVRQSWRERVNHTIEFYREAGGPH